MSRADGAHVLENVKEALLELHDHLSSAIEELDGDDIPESDVAGFLETQALHARDAYLAQLKLWSQLLSKERQGSLAGVLEASNNLEQQTQQGRKANIKERLAAMGATPALGNGMVLPKANRDQILHVTASPAAREIFLNTHGAALNTPLRTPAAKPSAPWLDELKDRKVASAVYSDSRVNKDLSSELAGVLSARASRVKVSSE